MNVVSREMGHISGNGSHTSEKGQLVLKLKFGGEPRDLMFCMISHLLVVQSLLSFS